MYSYKPKKNNTAMKTQDLELNFKKNNQILEQEHNSS